MNKFSLGRFSMQTYDVTIFLMCFHAATSSLHSKLSHFEVLTPRQMRTRTKRDATTGRVTHKSLRFNSLGVKFALSLKPGWSAVAKNLNSKLVNADGSFEPFTVDFSRAYTGSLHNKPRTSVKAFQYNGVWTAYIDDNGERYLIESLKWHEPQTISRKMIIYRARDVTLHNSSVENSTDDKCFVPKARTVHDHKQNKSRHQKNINHLLRSNRLERSIHSVRSNRSVRRDRSIRRKRSVRSINSVHSNRSLRSNRYVRSNQSESDTVLMKNSQCDMHIYVDTRMFEEQFNKDPIHATLQTIYYHCVANDVFKNTKFGQYRGMNNKIVGIFIMKEYSKEDSSAYEWNVKSKSHTPWHPDDLAFSLTKNPNNSLVCLNYVFTTKTIELTVLGAAYQGDTTDQGICSLDYNVGWTTMTHRGEIMMDRKYIDILTHEMGHSWGSSHDPKYDKKFGKECAPTELAGGAYLMYWKTNPGTSRNNQLFSKCSRRDIAKAIDQTGYRCFLPEHSASALESLCGDGVLDGGEECDDGHMVYKDAPNKCCNSKCRLRKNATCSVWNNPCCSITCTVAPASQKCGFRMGRPLCTQKRYCDGKNYDKCPSPSASPNGIQCGSTSNHQCFKGECVSKCQLAGAKMNPPRQLFSCMCNTSREDMCMRCCMGTNGSCSPSKERLTDGERCMVGLCVKGVCLDMKSFRILRLDVNLYEKVPILFCCAFTAPIFVVVNALSALYDRYIYL